VDLIEALFSIGPEVRYVAVAQGANIALRERAGLNSASSSESDRYEELLVNPTLLELARRRGDIDCGGLEYLVVRYGNFFQIVMARGDGHVSVAVEPTTDPIAVAAAVRAVLKETS
jgi:hypothetical protein